jgi:hypothetical protein
MKKLLLALGCLIIFSCASTQKLETMKPEPNAAASIKYMSETSFVHLPITLTLKDIEKQINKQLTGLIYNDSILDDDDIKLKVWKKKENYSRFYPFVWMPPISTDLTKWESN